MTDFEIEHLSFGRETAAALKQMSADGDRRFSDWPVVYVINNDTHVYVGETTSAARRLEQHYGNADKRRLHAVRLVLGRKFNKSACLDLESRLIEWFGADAKYQVLNSNKGQVDWDYYERDAYRATFEEIFQKLRDQKLFTRSITQIRNSDMFKLSPFKALNDGQAAAIDSLLDELFVDLATGTRSTSVVQGDPGTGKTIVAIYLLKLLEDIRTLDPAELHDADERFSERYVADKRALLEGKRIGLVIPQQSLRESVKRVFRRTPGLRKVPVLTPFQVGESDAPFDLLIVDEAHRLTQRANLGPLNKKRQLITEKLYGTDDPTKTQLDWIRDRSAHQIFLIDSEQSVRTADLPQDTQAALVAEAKTANRWHRLWSQMRVAGGDDYIAFVRALLSDDLPAPASFEHYDLRMFDDLGELRDAIRARDDEHGLSRLVAGYAWKWRTKKDRSAYDIELDGVSMRWNQTDKDWINSPGSVDEVGSIHTVQGYDLNYAGVIIGPDLRWDAERGRLAFDRASYFDKTAAQDNGALGIRYTDEDLLALVRNVYRVLMTRGMRGTYVYVCDRALRERMRGVLGGNG
ncbi:DNA/RNA helicase domain-containing protein [Microbacterium rhizophilus]|uniref:DNA/RNA helicase domain-containing protein n=1 Tax=Microbacterium rhizophilus TaxID=3138934 RepID=UPI0031EE1F45